MNLTRFVMMMTVAVALSLVTVFMPGCQEESPSAPAGTTSAQDHDHAGHTHDHDAGHMGATPTGGIPADVVLANDICPVSGEKFPRDSKYLARVDHDGKAYGLCCADCIDLFKDDPAKYLAKLEAREQAGSTTQPADAAAESTPAM